MNDSRQKKRNAADVRQDARRLLDAISATVDRGQRRRLAVRAFELAQLAEQLDFEDETGGKPLPPPESLQSS
jgi:hypothetical protein